MDDNKNLRYIRYGKCNRCGFCCLGGDKNEPCDKLEWKGNLPICTIYENRPRTCKEFPEMPPILTDKCGYYFVDLWERKILNAKEV